jgi:alpha-1,2-mannosyltransferase
VTRDSRKIRWNWVLVWSVASITIVTAIYAAWRSFLTTPGIDFVAFWAAGRLAIEGKAVLAYDLSVHHAMELTFVQLQGQMPFPYPPPFLLLVTPLGLLSFPYAFALWLIVTGGFYLWGTRRLAPLPWSIVLPPILPNALVGQNGFLFTGLFAFAVEALRTRPFVGGMFFGCLVLKPQLAPLIPVALVAGRAWRAVAGAALSSVLLILVGLIAFGFDSYVACAQIMAEYGQRISRESWPWTEMASVFAFFRFFGVSQPAAYTIQLVAAAVATAVTWRAWASNKESRAEVLAAAIVLLPPYLFTYDALLLVLPFAWLLKHGEKRAAFVVWITCMLPILYYFHIYTGPNTIPIAAIICLWRVSRAPRRSTECRGASSTAESSPVKS